ncbi:HAD-IC family P-type ATPase [Ruminococcus sp.]|uniref:HAD-IC family P-type ATPase n=1 Tax=Ruminococcus sp. TaxID=41978 RepID=UPI00388D3595
MSRKKTQKPPVDRIQASPDTGLTAAQVEERVRKGYVNVTDDPNEKTTGKIIRNNLFTFFNVVLFTIAAVFAGFMIYLHSIGRSDIVNEYFGFSKFVFLIPAVMNVAMGSFQEIKSMRVIKKLKIVTSTKSKVIRDGEAVMLDASQIVVDDIVALTAGDQATADLIVLSGEVDVDESMLTGEADHVKKKVGDTILSGSSIIVGSARCRADKVGNDTYASDLTYKVKSGARHSSELMSSIMRIIKVLTVGLCIAVIVTTVTLAVRIGATGSNTAVWGMPMSLRDPVTWSLIVLTDGMFGIGMIPSGLVLTTSVALMVSISQLTKKQTLIQELYSLENLSRVDVICLDKTGTLTDGTMSVFEVREFAPKAEIERHLRALIGSSEDRNATSEAMYQYFGEDKNADYREAIPFSSANKYSGIIYHDGKKLLMGAPEYLLDAGDQRLDYVTEKANEGNRVIAVTLDGELIAFVAIEDHIRDTAADTLRFFRENGVTVKVISGDNPLTVSKIAQKCGIENADRYISLAGVSLEEIPALAENYTVFARVSPEQKEALVMALQANKHKVAMTGDGVNDILALRRSDSSITFAKATEAAKSCSDVVLLDNDFSHLKEVVGEGRRVIGNIRKTAVLYLMKSIATFILAFALIPLAKAQMWFSVENMYMLEAAVIGTGGFLLSLEPRRTPVQGSFIKYIVSQSLGAGALGACAVLLPILLNVIPKALGYPPVIADANVRSMMTIMLSITGIVVVLAMCIPLNKYRALSLSAVTFVAAFLGLLLPEAYIGGNTIGASMLAYDKAAGQTIFDSQLVQQMFRPMNSPSVQSLLSDTNNYLVLRLFLYIAVPVFILISFAAENYSRKEYKDVRKNRYFRIGRRLVLVSGIALILHAMLTIVEVLTGSGSVITFGEATGSVTAVIVNIIYAILHLVIGVTGYLLWKNPTKKMINLTFIAGFALAALTLGPMDATSGQMAQGGVLLIIDNIELLVIVAAYLVGCTICHDNVHLGLAKARNT